MGCPQTRVEYSLAYGYVVHHTYNREATRNLGIFQFLGYSTVGL